MPLVSGSVKKEWREALEGLDRNETRIVVKSTGLRWGKTGALQSNKQTIYTEWVSPPFLPESQRFKTDRRAVVGPSVSTETSAVCGILYRYLNTELTHYAVQEQAMFWILHILKSFNVTSRTLCLVIPHDVCVAVLIVSLHSCSQGPCKQSHSMAAHLACIQKVRGSNFSTY